MTVANPPVPLITIKPLSPALTLTPAADIEHVLMAPIAIKSGGYVTEQVNPVEVNVSEPPAGVPLYNVAVTVVGLSKVTATVFIKVAFNVLNVPDCGNVCTSGNN